MNPSGSADPNYYVNKNAQKARPHLTKLQMQNASIGKLSHLTQMSAPIASWVYDGGSPSPILNGHEAGSRSNLPLLKPDGSAHIFSFKNSEILPYASNSNALGKNLVRTALLYNACINY